MSLPETHIHDPIRKFACPACGHQMIYGRRRCDACNEEAPVYNWRGFWQSLWICLAAVILTLAVWLVFG